MDTCEPVGDAYAVLAGPICHELVIDRSRFICYLTRVHAEAGAREFVEQTRADHRQARHHCSAFVLGERQQVRRSSDDGEPSGTAGVPMMDALSQYAPTASQFRVPEVTGLPVGDVAAVVVRYFGGVLLGAGGLVRAYSGSVSAALQHAHFRVRESVRIFHLHVSHAESGRWDNFLRQQNCQVEVADYQPGGVGFRIAVPNRAQALEGFDAAVERFGHGQIVPREGGLAWSDGP